VPVCSDFHRHRSLVSWGDDLAALADHLGLGRFALAGESGGGPFTPAHDVGHDRSDEIMTVIASGMDRRE
jgi:pimeloyl-ACP methyl ester carboxylesterase